MYFLAISLAVIGGVLLGIFGTTVYYTYFLENYERYNDDDWWDDNDD